MKASSTETGMVTIGTIADGMCQRKIRITSADDDHLLAERRASSVSMARADQVRAVVGRDDLDARRAATAGARRAAAFTRSMTASAFSPWRMTTIPPTVSPCAVEVGDAAPDVRARASPWRRRARGPACPSSDRRARRCSRGPRPSGRSRGRAPCTRCRRARGAARRPRCCPCGPRRRASAAGRRRRAAALGSTVTWYCFTKPPTAATSATPGTACRW